jgi:membrane associated rhomboid family serine protease
VYFLAVIPTPLWVTAMLFSFGSIAVVIAYGTGAFGIAHLAHAGGVFTGLAYGLTREESGVPRGLSPRMHRFLHFVQKRMNGRRRI